MCTGRQHRFENHNNELPEEVHQVKVCLPLKIFITRCRFGERPDLGSRWFLLLDRVNESNEAHALNGGGLELNILGLM